MRNSLEHFLESADGAARVVAHGRLLLKLSRRFQGILPANLGDAARVANIKSGKLVIHADNGAVAAKIRQLGQRICDELSKTGAQCSVIEVKVQPRQFSYQSMVSTIKPLSPTAYGALRRTGQGLPEDSPLRRALEKLLDRAAQETQNK